MATTLLKNSREYTDIDFLFTRHPLTDNLTIKKGPNSVKQSIMNLLQLKPGDKPFHPEIKSPIYDYLFENASNIVSVVLEGEIRKYLNAYEPRVIILTVRVTFPSNNEISCKLEGTIVNLQSPFTVNVLINRLR